MVAVVGGTAPLCLFLENSHGKVDDAPPALGFPSIPNFRRFLHFFIDHLNRLCRMVAVVGDCHSLYSLGKQVKHPGAWLSPIFDTASTNAFPAMGK